MTRMRDPQRQDTPPVQEAHRLVVQGELHEDGCADLDCPGCPAVWVEDADGRYWTISELVQELERRIGLRISRARVTVEVPRTLEERFAALSHARVTVEVI